MRNRLTFKVDDSDGFKEKLYLWADSFETSLCLDNNNNANPQNFHSYEFIAGAGVLDFVSCPAGDAFQVLENYNREKKDWLLGYLSYDLKNETEKLSSENYDGLNFPDLYFFRPLHIILMREAGEVEILTYGNCEDVKTEILCFAGQVRDKSVSAKLTVTPRMNREEYLEKVIAVRNHILEGDVYEMNLCMEFYAENVVLPPLETYLRLREASPTPFGAFFKNKEDFLLCASPERFIKKEGSRLISQPIKGTIRRSDNEFEDGKRREELKNNEKERAENVMIVDLVRNDLAKSSVPGTVIVDELFGIYTFRHLHHMISTVSSKIKENVSAVQSIKNAFPMGSMTGAPKVMAMELIEELENTKRGIYSGTLGYFSPNGDFDFNVIIRSIAYNRERKYLSFHVGSAITWDASPEKEYDECLLKASAILKVLG